jgi:transcriptional regulator with PAS, ATPase and Fis domain
LYQWYARDKAEKKLRKEAKIKAQIQECDKKIFRNKLRRSEKVYNLIQTATILGVHRQTIYYWIKKGWLKPKRDYRNYPIFTVLDIENIIKWRNTIKL